MKFTYTGDTARTFPDQRLEVEPGDVVEFDENPDPIFFAAVDSAPAVPVEASDL